jgi:DNA-directed RNA polymerase specialized sigma24 family protein
MITENPETEGLINSTRDIHTIFNEAVAHFRNALRDYSQHVTGSPWYGDELFQETLLKAYGFLHQWKSQNVKSYFSR